MTNHTDLRPRGKNAIAHAKAEKDFFEICEAISVSPEIIRGRIRKHHKDRRFISHVMFREGHSANRIATIMHKDHTTILAHLKSEEA